MAPKKTGIETWTDPRTNELTALWASIPNGARLRGLAPIGIRWEATKKGPQKVKPDGKLAASEFAVTDVWLDGDWLPVRVDPIERIDVDGKSTWHTPSGLAWQLHELRSLLGGGYIEAVRIPAGAPAMTPNDFLFDIVLCDEDGRMRGLPLNPASLRAGRDLVGVLLFAPRRAWS